MSFSEADALFELADKQREEMARELFNYDTVSEQLTKAAVAGLNELRIGLDEQIDLRETKAAKCLVERLTAAKFMVRWIESGERETYSGRETGRFLLFYEVTISWGNISRKGRQDEVVE